MQLEKLKNLRQDTIIKKQKTSIAKEKYRLEFCEGVLIAFSESFIDLKNYLIQQKMNKQQIDIFNRVFQSCLKKFDGKLKKYIADKDREE